MSVSDVGISLCVDSTNDTTVCLLPDIAKMRTLTALTSVLLLCHLASAQEPVVSTDKGQIRGFTQRVLGGDKLVETFLGVPFASPPLGPLRFQPPTQLDPWEGILNTTELPNACVQPLDDFFGNFTGSTVWNANTPLSEDCLYLNVWVPKTDTQKKSVLIWIYGGSFYSGSSALDIYDAKILAAETDVIVVSMQYRVGALGFLSLDTPEAPGNAGLWDQRMALEWVNRNIHQFGGDPQSVTLMGESAGAVSVGLFLICDLCRGYFHRAILQSGAPHVGWGVRPKEEMWRRSQLLAEKVGCAEEDSSTDEVVACLRKVDTSQFLQFQFVDVQGQAQFPFVPTVDGIFIRQDPKTMIENGYFKKIPLLIGSNQNEATYFLIYSDKSLYNRETSSTLAPEFYEKTIDEQQFKYYPAYPNELSELGRSAIKFQYRNWLNPNNGTENRKSVDHAVSDAYFVCPVNELALAYGRQDAPVYYYWFNQRWSANPWPEWMGVLHADEIWFTFGHPVDTSKPFTQDERHLSRKMMDYWTNFAKTGNPNGDLGDSDWPKFTPAEQKYKILDTDVMHKGELSIGQYPRTQECAFWEVYMPNLLRDRSHTADAESSWLGQFETWKRRYIEGWNDQFETFLGSFKDKTGRCGGNS